MSRTALFAAFAALVLINAGCRSWGNRNENSGSGKLELEYAGKTAVDNLHSSRFSELLAALGNEHVSGARKQELSDLAAQTRNKADFDLLYAVSCESSDYCTLLAGKRSDGLAEVRKIIRDRIKLDTALAFTDIVYANSVWGVVPEAQEMLMFRRMELAAFLGCRSDELPEISAANLAEPAELKKRYPLPEVLKERYKNDLSGILHYAYILFSFPQELARRIEADKKFAVGETVRNAIDLGTRYRISLAENRMDKFLKEYRNAVGFADRNRALRNWRRWYYRREYELKRLYSTAAGVPENQFVADLLMLSDEL